MPIMRKKKCEEIVEYIKANNLLNDNGIPLNVLRRVIRRIAGSTEYTIKAYLDELVTLDFLDLNVKDNKEFYELR